MPSLRQRLRLLYLQYFSQPARERPLYKLVQQLRPTHLLLVGLGDGQRALRMLQTAQAATPQTRITLTGIDLFDLRPAGQPQLTLKSAHQGLAASGARVRLLPGDVHEALARSANALGQVDLVLIAHGQAAEALERAWFFVPRLLHSRTVLLWEREAEAAPVRLAAAELQRLATRGGRKRRAA